MKIVFFGTPDFAVPSLKMLYDSCEDIKAVVTQPDRAKGRGHILSEPPVKQFAASKEIPVFQPTDIKDPRFFSEISRTKPDVIVVVAYGKIIPPPLLVLPPLGCVNVHGSLLPKYRGAAPVQWAIINGEDKTGITTMLMNEGLDTGDILLQEEVPINEDDNAYSLALSLSRVGAFLLEKTLKGLLEGTVRRVPQRGVPSYAPPLRKEDGKIDWLKESGKISNLVRGTFPWPGAYCSLGGQRITILKADKGGDSPEAIPGRIEAIDETGIYVGTGRGLLRVAEVKPEGRKAMHAVAFARGKRLREGGSFDIS